MLTDFNNIENFEKSSESYEDNKPISLKRKNITKTKDKIKDIFRLVDEKIANRKEIRAILNLIKEKENLVTNAQLKMQWNIFFEKTFDSLLIANATGFFLMIFLDITLSLSLKEVMGETNFLIYFFTLCFFILMPIVMLITYRHSLREIDKSISLDLKKMNELFEVDSTIRSSIQKKLNKSKSILGNNNNNSVEVLLKEFYKTNNNELNMHIDECVRKYVKKMDFSDFEKEMPEKQNYVVHSEIFQELDARIMDIMLEHGKTDSNITKTVNSVNNNAFNSLLAIGGFDEFK